MPNLMISLRWRIAVPGIDPAVKFTRREGKQLEIFQVLLYCWSTQDISLGDRKRLASPDMRTGSPYVNIILTDATGFLSPQEITNCSNYSGSEHTTDCVDVLS